MFLEALEGTTSLPLGAYSWAEAPVTPVSSVFSRGFDSPTAADAVGLVGIWTLLRGLDSPTPGEVVGPEVVRSTGCWDADGSSALAELMLVKDVGSCVDSICGALAVRMGSSAVLGLMVLLGSMVLVVDGLETSRLWSSFAVLVLARSALATGLAGFA